MTEKSDQPISNVEIDQVDMAPVTSMSKATIQITNRRYNNDRFWGGPKGLEYALLIGAQPIQQPVLFPDQGSTYFVAQFQLPEGAILEIKGEFGHLRYLSYTIAGILENGALGNGPFLLDADIEPDDDGSINPFRANAPRDDGSKRNYTIHIIQGNPPSDSNGGTQSSDKPPSNALYTGAKPGTRLHLALRNYIPDVGYDGTGNRRLDDTDGGPGLPQVIQLRIGTEVFTGDEMWEKLQVSKAGEQRNFTFKNWVELVKGSWDPVSAPAQPNIMAFQRFWNIDYSVTGGFILDPLERVKRYPAADLGGFAANPNTIFMSGMFSIAYGQVVVIRGKMPSHVSTRRGAKTWPADTTQVRYWSASTGGSPPTGMGWMSVFDEEVPLVDGYFTLVMSWAEDRPKNAVRRNGVIWIDFGGGEGHYVGARNWVNIVYLRYMNPASGDDWPESPANIPPPTVDQPFPQDAMTMKEYYPTTYYMSKEQFENSLPMILNMTRG